MAHTRSRWSSVVSDGSRGLSKKAVGQPSNPFHPGEVLLEEFLVPGSISQAAFARKIGWTKARLNELIKAKRGVTAEAALDLAHALGTSPRLWMNLQATFDLAAAERKRRADSRTPSAPKVNQ